jgi:two-component system phosphate regulon sensor histidine kinase PhoR
MGPARDDPLVRQRFLGIMRGEAERMNRLVSELLSLSRIEMNEHQPPAGRADLGNVLKTVKDSLSLKAEQRQIKLVFPGLAELPSIPGDADELIQAIQNLVDNAIKYAPEQSEVRIAYRRIEDPVACREHLPGLRAPKAMVALSVTDQGEGIPREHIPRLTERFYRVDAARSRQQGGTGLGLAIVKHISNRHRGSLEIESTPGQGSSFTLYLPAEA